MPPNVLDNNEPDTMNELGNHTSNEGEPVPHSPPIPVQSTKAHEGQPANRGSPSVFEANHGPSPAQPANTQEQLPSPAQPTEIHAPVLPAQHAEVHAP